MSGTWDDGHQVPVSISHDGEYATATALGYDSTTDAAGLIDTSVGQSQSSDEWGGDIGSIDEPLDASTREEKPPQISEFLDRDELTLTLIKDMAKRSHALQYYVRVTNIPKSWKAHSHVSFTRRINKSEVFFPGRVAKRGTHQGFAVIGIPLEFTKEAGREMIYRCLKLRVDESRLNGHKHHGSLIFEVRTEEEYDAIMQRNIKRMQERLSEGTCRGSSVLGAANP